MSANAEIDRIKFVRFPTKASPKVSKIVRVDTFVFALIDDRTVACSKDLSGFAYPANNRAFPWMDAVIDGLVRLGCISQKARREHLDRCKANGDKKEREYAADKLVSSAKTLGIVLTAAQKRKLPKTAGGEG